jgi:hypothetical protein
MTTLSAPQINSELEQWVYASYLLSSATTAELVRLPSAHRVETAFIKILGLRPKCKSSFCRVGKNREQC